jgi:membrane protein DedA with SNARE-associated domain
MDSLLHPVAEFISRHHAWAAAVLGAITFFESLVLIGAFIPATALMVLAGGLVAAGVLDPLPVIVCCVIGATLGDAVSYTLGRNLGPGALRHPMFKRHRRNVARTRLFTRRHGGLAIFVGRFFGPLRAFVPLVAGVLQMKSRSFQIANAVSAVVWVLAILAPGYFAAKGLAELEALWEADPLTILIAAAVLAVTGGIAAWRILAHRWAQREARAADALLRRADLA